jgi:dihydrofolate reductase
MRKIIFLIHISLDGYVAGPNGEMDWIVYTDELESYVHALHASTDAAIYGRVTYQLMEGYWPHVLDAPASTEGACSRMTRWRSLPASSPSPARTCGCWAVPASPAC